MRYAHFTEEVQSSYPIALLVPDIRKTEIEKAYFTDSPIETDDVIVIDLHISQEKKKTPVSEIKEYLNEELVETLNDLKVEYVLCGQGDYFKVLTGAKKIEPHVGYVMDSKFGDWKVVYVPNYPTIFYDPDKIKAQISAGVLAVATHRNGCYVEPGKNVLKTAHYPKSPAEIINWIWNLEQMQVPLTADIEAFSLKHHSAGIGTIAFAWNKHEGVAFPVDLVGNDESAKIIRNALRQFFVRNRHRILWHNITYDVYVLIYQLFMTDILDTEGLLDGLEVMLRNWDCTKIITFLATNSCAGNDLSLKGNAQDFAGNWAQDDIKDITKIPLDQLLEYNLIDACATWHVHDKHWDTMVLDGQLEPYIRIFKPAVADIIQMQLTGLPMNIERVGEVKEILSAIEQDALATMQDNPLAHALVDHLNREWVIKRNEKLKKKRVTLDDAGEEFNPNSPQQLQTLLFQIAELPVLGYTDSKQPSTDGDTIEALENHTKDPTILEFLSALRDFKAVNKLLTAFIPAFEDSVKGPDDWHYLFGNFNLGGTLSGRLSSSDPNLQNLPANVLMKVSEAFIAQFGARLDGYIFKGKLALGKLIKSCFEAPPGWLFAGLDFDSLEDRISALTTKDPNKLKVYTDGYDGHCLRAYSYFGENMPDIDPDSVISINSIADKYPTERHDSKAPTFALTYRGTVNTLMVKNGFSYEMALNIYNKYQELYAVSIDWINKQLDEASRTGYITVAFGLRVRTPLLKQVIRGTSKTPYEAEAEGRSAGNAAGQSWCQLNNRAGSEFMGKVRKSKYRLDIRPGAHIHDAQYFLMRDDLEVVEYANIHLVKAVQWQDDPAIWHDQVKLGGKLGIFYPNWTKEIEIPNGATKEEILEIVNSHAH